MNRWSPDLYIKACNFAAEQHKGQTLAGSGLPYLVHINLVTMEIIAALTVERLEQPDLAVTCALLHDVIEDTEATYDTVSQEFGSDVAMGVDALSKREDAGDYPAHMADSLNRIRMQPREIWMVKLADRITNLQPPPPHWNLEKRKYYLEEAETIELTLGESSEYLKNRLAVKRKAYHKYL